MWSFFNSFWSRGNGSSTNVSSVPEIDASTGLLAMAALGAALLFAWERRRRLAKKA